MTQRATWKAYERAVAKFLGGLRVPITGRARGDAPDINTPLFAVEVKLRKNFPVLIAKAMQQAEASVRDSKLPLVVIGKAGIGHPVRKSLAVMYLEDFAELLGALWSVEHDEASDG